MTNTDQAIRYVRENVIFRQDITKVMVVITDGGSRSPGMLSIQVIFHSDLLGTTQAQSSLIHTEFLHRLLKKGEEEEAGEL